MKTTYRQTLRSVQSGKLAPVYLLMGDDFFLQDFLIGQIEKTMSTEAQPDRVWLTPEGGDYDRIPQELNAVSLFPEPKLFILRNPLQIRGRPREELLAYCRSPNQDNCLVIIIDKYDPQKKLIKELSRPVPSVNCSPPFPEEMAQWVSFFLKQHRMTATDEAIDRLIELSGDSVFHIANEIDKIVLGLGDQDVVQETDVERYAGWRRRFSPRHLLDAVGNRNFDQAVVVGKSLLNHGSDISMLISQLTSVFQGLMFRYQDKGVNQTRSLPELWLNRYVRGRLPEYQKHYTVNDVERTFRILANADRRVKSQGNDSLAVLIPLVYRITTTGV